MTPACVLFLIIEFIPTEVWLPLPTARHFVLDMTLPGSLSRLHSVVLFFLISDKPVLVVLHVSIKFLLTSVVCLIEPRCPRSAQSHVLCGALSNAATLLDTRLLWCGGRRRLSRVLQSMTACPPKYTQATSRRGTVSGIRQARITFSFLALQYLALCVPSLVSSYVYQLSSREPISIYIWRIGGHRAGPVRRPCQPLLGASGSLRWFSGFHVHF